MELDDVKFLHEGSIEEKLQHIERQITTEVVEFGFILREDGLVLDKTKGFKDFLRFNAVGKEALQFSKSKLYVTHNHPSGNLTFSMADLNTFFLSPPLIELRATSKGQTHILDTKNVALKNQYLKLRQEKVAVKEKMRVHGLITEEEFDSWIAWDLPTEIQHELPLTTKLINL